MRPRLTILLGAGGVGKTTLAAGLALAHARAGSSAALLSVDPSRRLRSALGLADLPETGVPVPGAGLGGRLDAALLDPAVTFRRWAAEACPDEKARVELTRSPYFRAFADRLAGFTDAIGCLRAAEWAERTPGLQELVLDTAPGVPAVEVLARPEKLAAVLDDGTLRVLLRLTRAGESGGRVLAALAGLCGAGALREFGWFLAAGEGLIARMIPRLEFSRTWIADPRTRIVIVSAPTPESARVAAVLEDTLRKHGFRPSLLVLNRVLPAALTGGAPVPEAGSREPRDLFVRFVRNRLRAQQTVRTWVADGEVPVLEIPEASELHGTSRLEALASLGEPLREQLSAPPRAVSGRRAAGR